MKLQLIFLILCSTGFAIAKHGKTDKTSAERIEIREDLVETDKTYGEKVEKRKDFPYQASIRYKNKHYCGGSIIGSKKILTAARCCFSKKLKEIEPTSYQVVVGSLNLEESSSSTVVRNVESVRCHKNFSYKSHKHDIAVMTLDKELKWTKNIKSIELAENTSSDYRSCKVSGWGLTEKVKKPHAELQMSITVIVNLQTCKQIYSEESVTAGMLCTGYEDDLETNCQSDTGGPLACDNVLYGVMSWGNGCHDSKKPMVFTDVAYYRDWINELESNCAKCLHNQISCLLLLLLFIVCNKNYNFCFFNYFKNNNLL